MSSEDEHDDFGGSDDKNKKRRIQRACDTCRRKKIRCDGSQMADNRCTNCIQWNQECTYVEAAKKRGPPKGYVESLENRLEKMEKLLRSLCPDADFTKELGTFMDRETWYHERSSKNGSSSSHTGGTSNNPNALNRRGPIPVEGMPSKQRSEEDFLPSDDEFLHVTLAEGLRQLQVDQHDRRFHGKSSGIMLIQAAMDFKREYSGRQGEDGGNVFGNDIPDSRREEFWLPNEWEKDGSELSQPPPVDFPPDDLIQSLLPLYFENCNTFFPLHHRQTFERNYRQGLHKTNRAFASTLLLTCACASRWSDDSRCLIDGVTRHSAGWAWFTSALSMRRNQLAQPSLYDVQVYGLAAMFLMGSSAPQAAWTLIGIGMRCAQDVGAHRRKTVNAANMVEDEQWKRLFWTLVALDRGTSSSLGRPCAIQDEDFDVDHPLEVDDEYWENPDSSLAFKQPPGKPARVSFFNCYLKLCQILAFALRTIYSINKSKILLGFVGPQWEQHIVAELDSALNKWIDSVPDHLRWDPNREDPLFFAQSATLYAMYYHLQILIHRPFIPTPRKPSPLSFPSLAICTNAARSCSHVLDIARRRTSTIYPFNTPAAFTSGIVLLLNIWGAKKSGMQTDPSKQMQDVHKCMQHLKDVEDRFRAAGRLWDVLRELASVGELPLPHPSPPGTNRSKRERDSDQPINAARAPITVKDIPTINAPRAIAKSRATHSHSHSVTRPTSGSTSQNTTPPLQVPSYSHPVPSHLLGQMPLNPEMGLNGGGHSTLDAMNWDSYTMPQSTQQLHPSSASSGSAYRQTVASHQGYASQSSQMPGAAQMYGVFSNPSPSQDMQYATQFPQQTSAMGITNAQGAGGFGGHDQLAGMWSNAPPGFEYADWGDYLSSGIDPTTGLLTGVATDAPMQHDQQ